MPDLGVLSRVVAGGVFVIAFVVVFEWFAQAIERKRARKQRLAFTRALRQEIREEREIE